MSGGTGGTGGGRTHQAVLGKIDGGLVRFGELARLREDNGGPDAGEPREEANGGGAGPRARRRQAEQRHDAHEHVARLQQEQQRAGARLVPDLRGHHGGGGQAQRPRHARRRGRGRGRGLQRSHARTMRAPPAGDVEPEVQQHRQRLHISIPRACASRVSQRPLRGGRRPPTYTIEGKGERVDGQRHDAEALVAAPHAAQAVRALDPGLPGGEGTAARARRAHGGPRTS